jgi:hypothetical protein
MVKAKKPVFARTTLPLVEDGQWRVCVLKWTPRKGAPVTGTELAAIETSDLGLAIMAAHRLIDLHGHEAAPFVSVEIVSADPAQGDWL